MKKCKGNPHEEVEKKPRILSHQTTVKMNAKSKSTNSTIHSKINGGHSGKGPNRILRSSIVDKKRTNRPRANHQNGTEYDDFVEIIESAKNSVGRPRKLVPHVASNELTENATNKKSVGRPRVQRAAPIEIIPAAVNANVASPSAAISSIVKECSNSNSIMHDIDPVHGKIAKIEFNCQPGPSSLR